jgi:AcrR family transcriptional regulator
MLSPTKANPLHLIICSVPFISPYRRSQYHTVGYVLHSPAPIHTLPYGSDLVSHLETNLAKADALSRRDWVTAALSALSEGGIEAVKVERLAATLGVSKGSFYWHFADRRELLKALLEFWATEFTSQLIDSSSMQPNPRLRLQALGDEALEAKAGTLDVAQTESALRAWAALDDQARDGVRRVDADRLDYLTSELRAVGAPAAEAETLAKAVYLALLGLYTARTYTPQLADDAAFRKIVSMALDAAEKGKRRR